MAALENPQVRLRKFEGPLDLLFHLIEKNDIDIYDIPIADVDKMNSLDMEVASEFLLMAATLVHIKSRMLLPDRNVSEDSSEPDPREELVVKLLEYRRCKMLASDLKDRYRDYSKCVYRLPQTASSLGIKVENIPAPVDEDGHFSVSAGGAVYAVSVQLKDNTKTYQTDGKYV